MKCFGWKAVKLADLDMADLMALQAQVVADPASANPQHKNGGSIWLYTKAARRKLDAIGWAVTYKLQRLAKESAPDNLTPGGS